MKKRFFMNFLLMLLVALPLAAQKSGTKLVTLTFQNEPLSTSLKRIEKASDVKILFVYDDVKSYTVNANVRGVTATQAVDEVLKGTQLSYSVKGNYISVAKKTDGGVKLPGKGEKTITGTCIDEDGEPLPGVVVRMVGNSGGAVTDVNGHFQMAVPEDCRQIEAQFLGMSTERVVVGNGRDIRITMRNAESLLNEVVVTGYQDMKKEKITGSTVTIRADKLETRYTPNVLDNLEGRVAGLSTYGGDLKIRGTSSLYAESSPLLVVDGLPIEGKISDLNPYDIQSINVLKDAAATAIYGARASNGIIVITTKNARQKGKIDIDFQTNLTITQTKNVDYADNHYLNAAQQIAMERDGYHWTYFEEPGIKGTDPFASFENNMMMGTMDVSPIEHAYYRWAKGEITEADVNALCDKLSKNNFAKEFADAVYRQEVLQQYNMAMRHRSDKTQNNVTVNYKHDNLGIINNKFEQLNVSYKGIYDVSNWLTATMSIDGLYSNRRNKGYDYSGDRFATPFSAPAYMSMYNDDGSRRRFHPWYDGNEFMTVPAGFRDQSLDVVDEYYNNVVNTRRQRMRYHGELLVKPFTGFTATAQLVYETDHNTAEWHAKEESHVSAVIRNAFTQRNPDGSVTYRTPETGGMLQTTDTNGDYWTTRFQANYARTFGKHDINAIAGLELRQTHYKGSKALALGFDDQLQTSSTHTVNFYELGIENYNPYSYIGGSRGGFPCNQFAFNPYLRDGMGVVTETTHRFASGYFNATYTYDEKYNVFGSFRKDWADVYGLNSKFRGKPLWSVGLGWNAHNEDFIRSIEAIDFLKLRLTYGVTGNIYQGATSYMTAGVKGNNDMTGLPIASIISPANPNLRWEQSRTLNLGIDAGLLDNRLAVSIDLYRKKGVDLFSSKTLDPTTGFTSMFVNLADMVNKGVELQTTYEWFRNTHQKDFGWSTSLTYTYNHNEVTKVDNPSTKAYERVWYNEAEFPFVEGYAASGLWSYRFAGYEDANSSHGAAPGETLWFVDDAKTSTNDPATCAASHNAQSRSVDILEYSGQADPKHILGLDNRFTWNGFSLSVMIAYYGGHVMRCLDKSESLTGNYMAYEDKFLRPWTPEETDPTGPGMGRYPSSSLGPEPASGNNAIHDASFIKIRNIVFGYDFPRNIVQKIGVNHLGLRFQINNPKAIWTANKVNIDPETLGVRNPSSFVFGLNINL